MKSSEPASLQGRVVAVTGASGGIGLASVRRLVAAGATVRGLTRTAAGAEHLREAGAQAVQGDIADANALAALFAGADLALHLAAWMGGKGGAAEAQRVNVEGTRAVASSAVAAGVSRLVHVSSIAVYGPTLTGDVTESHPTREVGDPYGDTKLRGEQVVTEVTAGGPELVILRPTMVYGPRVASWTLTPLKALAAGAPLVFGKGDYLLDAVYVDDVARAAVLALTAPAASGRTYNVTGAATTWGEFFGAYAAMLGKPLRRLPTWLVRGGARFAATVTRPLGDARVVGETVETMLSRATFSGAAAVTDLGYAPAVSLANGMRTTAAWLRTAGYLSGPRVAMVVGAGSGLGLAVAEELVRRYVPLVAADLDPTALNAVPSLAGATVVTLDVLDPASIAAALKGVSELGMAPDAVVITVGGLKPGALESQPLADVRRQLDLNAIGPLNVVRAVAPGMRARGRGRVVAVGSTNGLLVTPFMGAYSAGKFALEALMDALRLELRPFGVEVVLVQPGAMRTPFAARAKAQLSAEAERTGAPWDAYLKRLRDSNLWGESNAADPAKVASIVVRAATSKHAPARVRGTPEVPFVRFFSYFPDRIKDLPFVRPLGLKRPNGRRAR